MQKFITCDFHPPKATVNRANASNVFAVNCSFFVVLVFSENKKCDLKLDQSKKEP